MCWKYRPDDTERFRTGSKWFGWRELPQSVGGLREARGDGTHANLFDMGTKMGFINGCILSETDLSLIFITHWYQIPLCHKHLFKIKSSESLNPTAKYTKIQCMSVRSYLKLYPYLQGFFHFPTFNPMQQQCIPHLLDTLHSMIVSAPTSTGKTALFEMAILKCLNHLSNLSNPTPIKCVYLAPIKSLCQQKLQEWTTKFPSLKVIEVTSDSGDCDVESIKQANILIATSEKLDHMTRNSILNFQINLLLVDEIHMLNTEVRGGVLEAVVTRFILKWPKLRVIAVSATIANTKDLAGWLTISPECVKEFGEEYRPVKVKKVVLGYRPSKNAFLFERSLTMRLEEIIVRYSDKKPCLVFCQTQKGTIAACEHLAQCLPRNYLLTDDEQVRVLMNKSKYVSQKTLSYLMTAGVAYHNASLSVEDRNLVIELFIEQKIRVICTTSTLSQGMNLPARLVVIKGTIAYRGAEKGYTDYSGTEIEQMVGRAGRVGFDTEGTAVIMTENSHVTKYERESFIDNMESHLFGQIKEHINVEISLGNIRSLEGSIAYLNKTFYYVRIGKDPLKYNLRNGVDRDDHIRAVCEETLKELTQYELIKQVNNQIIPLELCVELSKSSVSFTTTKHLLNNLNEVKSLETFVNLICGASEIEKFRSKLDQRKCLKELNSINRFKLKDTISTPSKKAFVLIQAHLSKFSFSDWELKKQASEIATILKSVVYILKNILKEKKLFLPAFCCVSFLRFLQKDIWNFPEDLVIANVAPLKEKASLIKEADIKTLEGLMEAIETKRLAEVCLQPDPFADYINEYLNNYSRIELSASKSADLQILIEYKIKWSQEMRFFTLVIGSSTLYTIQQSRQGDTSMKVYLRKYSTPLKIAIVLDNTIGFDRFYEMDDSCNFRKVRAFDNEVKEIQTGLRDYSSLKKMSKRNSALDNTASSDRKSFPSVRKPRHTQTEECSTSLPHSYKKSARTRNPRRLRQVEKQCGLVEFTPDLKMEKSLRHEQRQDSPSLQMTPCSNRKKPCIIEDLSLQFDGSPWMYTSNKKMKTGNEREKSTEQSRQQPREQSKWMASQNLVSDSKVCGRPLKGFPKGFSYLSDLIDKL